MIEGLSVSPVLCQLLPGGSLELAERAVVGRLLDGDGGPTLVVLVKTTHVVTLS